jgi:hypothetical protein
MILGVRVCVSLSGITSRTRQTHRTTEPCLFTTQAAMAVALLFFALTAWRWWAIALYRKARERAAAKDTEADT